MSRPRGPTPARSAAVQLRTFPSTDPTFRTFARAALLRTMSVTPGQFQTRVRERYPAAVIRVQDELARRGDMLVWYAFRYGSVVEAPATPVVDWDQPGLAEAVIDDGRRFISVNDELVAIVELPREAIIGRPLEDFTNPEDPTIRDDMAAMWAEFVETRLAESSIRFNRLDGTPRQLAFRIVADDPEPGRHRLRVRELPLETD
jgi:PAS domain-containing protein